MRIRPDRLIIARRLRRALIASTVGTTIEWYDFLLFSIVTGLAFGAAFSPPRLEHYRWRCADG